MHLIHKRGRVVEVSTREVVASIYISLVPLTLTDDHQIYETMYDSFANTFIDIGECAKFDVLSMHYSNYVYPSRFELLPLLVIIRFFII